LVCGAGGQLAIPIINFRNVRSIVDETKLAPHPRITGSRLCSRRRGIIFALLLDVAVFDLLHEGFAIEEVALEVGGDLAGDKEELVVGNFGKRDRAAGRNEMCAPLENKAVVPESEDGKQANRSDEGGALGVEELSGAIEENGEA